MRVLVSFESEYRVYIQAIATAIREFRADVEVVVADAGELEVQAQRFDPEVVITSPSVPENLVDEQLGCIELSPDSAQPSRSRIEERRWESTNPTLDEILSVVDETKRGRRQAREQELTDVDEEEV